MVFVWLFVPEVSSPFPPYLKDLIHSQVCQNLALRGLCCEGPSGGGGAVPSPTSDSPDTLCSSLCSLDELHPLLRDLGATGKPHHHPHSNAAELAAKILSVLQGGEELLLARLQRAATGPRSPAGGSGGGQDSPCYSASYSETYLSPGEEEEEGEEGPCKGYKTTVCQVGEEHLPSRRVSDVASSGVVSLDEEEEEEEEGQERLAHSQ